MSYGFEPGRIYNRRSDIHARFGGQQQGGIITPSQHSLVIIITGEEGLEHGYADRYRADDGGPDHPAHVIALCPNCHRRVHAGADGEAYNAKLDGSMATIEP